jgi:hypothetical protein
VTSKSPLPDEDDDVKLTGAGLGFRSSFDQTRLRLDLGFPIAPKESLGGSPAICGQIEMRF